MAESKDIIAYLYKTYAVFTPPNELLQYASGVTTLLAPLFKAIAPLQAGSYKDNEFEYKSELAEAKAAVYEEIASGPVVICESNFALYSYLYVFCIITITICFQIHMNCHRFALRQLYFLRTVE